MEEEEKLISQFNDAILQIQRLDEIWKECRRCREKGLLLVWKWKLDSAELELNDDAERLDGNKEDNEKKTTFATKINNADREILIAQKKKDWTSFYLKLFEKEKILRSIQNSAGKGGKLKPEDDDWM